MAVQLCLKDSCRKLSGHKGSHDRFPSTPLANLPVEIVKKIDKTAMTRGAQPYGRVPYQNRVRRWNRAVVPLRFRGARPQDGYENGFVIMVRPEEYFDPTTKAKQRDFPITVVIGQNAFVYYDNRKTWRDYPPQNQGWKPCRVSVDGLAARRRDPAGKDEGHYLARVPATTAHGDEGKEVIQGMPQGIRFFEFASQETTWQIMMQLAFLAWQTEGLRDFAAGPMPPALQVILESLGLADIPRLEALRVIRAGITCCPLCLESIQATDLMEKVEQAEGREVVDLTITEANLFHLQPLLPGVFNHITYGLGWGHHHCNAAARDMGITETLDWMERILRNSGRALK